MSSGCPLLPWCRANTRHLSSDHTLHPRCLVPSPSPSPCFSPEPLPLPTYPEEGKVRQTLGERSSFCQFTNGKDCFIYGLARACSHVCFYLHFYPKLSFLSLGGAYILYLSFNFSIFIFPHLTSSQVEKSKMVNPIGSLLPTEMVLGRDWVSRALLMLTPDVVTHTFSCFPSWFGGDSSCLFQKCLRLIRRGVDFGKEFTLFLEYFSLTTTRVNVAGILFSFFHYVLLTLLGFRRESLGHWLNSPILFQNIIPIVYRNNT